MGAIRILVTAVLLAAAMLQVRGQTAAGPRIVVAVVDSVTAEPLAGAVVEMLDEGMGLRAYAASGEDGTAVIGGAENGRYLLRVSLLGYETKMMEVEKTSDVFDAGVCRMRSSVIALEAAVHTEQSVRSSQSGDTITYNAASYKVMTGADTESLIAKMPGIVMTESGVDAHGRDVRKITVDGREFFGDDVMTALKNIPADMVKEIEVVNRKSDIAELTGTDDGNSYAAINIVTKPETRNGMLSGKVYGGYGYKDKYIAGTGLNWFDEKYSLSVLAMSNNMNRFNFMADDITGSEDGSSAGKSFRMKELPGVSDVHSAGVNFSNRWITGTYFFNCTDNDNETENHRRRAETEAETLLTDQNTSSWAKNYNHRFSSKITLSPSGRHSFIIRPELNLQDNSSGSTQKSIYNKLFIGGEQKFLRNRLTGNNTDRWSLAAALRVTYRYKFDKKGRTLSIYGSGSYNDGKSGTTSHQYTFRDPDLPLDPEFATSLSSQMKDNMTARTVGTGMVTYTEPLGRRSRLSIEYKVMWDRSDADNKVYLHDKATGTYGDTPDSRQSALNMSTFFTNSINVRYNYSFRKVALTASAGWQNVAFSSDVELPYLSSSQKRFNDAVYRVVANIPFNSSHSLRLEARSRTSNPSATRLQDVVNLANLSSIRAGNPQLVPSYINDLSARYIYTDQKMGSTLSVNASYSSSSDYVSDSLVVNSPDFEVTDGVLLGEGNQFIKPVNMKGYRRLTGAVTYGVPLKFLRSNLSITASASASRLPSMVNETYAPIKKDWYNAGVKLTSNISEKVDFTIGYSGRFNINSQVTGAGRLENNYLTHRASAWLKWVFWRGFTFTGSFTWRQNRSLDGRFDDRTCLCDLYIGRRLFKNGLGEISIGVTDLFDGNARRLGVAVSQGLNSFACRFPELAAGGPENACRAAEHS